MEIKYYFSLFFDLFNIIYILILGNNILLQVQQFKLLVVFDFDYFFVDGNTDIWVIKLFLFIMQLIREYQKKGWCWINVMDKVFGVLYVENLIKEDYEKCFEIL